MQIYRWLYTWNDYWFLQYKKYHKDSLVDNVYQVINSYLFLYMFYYIIDNDLYYNSNKITSLIKILHRFWLIFIIHRTYYLQCKQNDYVSLNRICID